MLARPRHFMMSSCRKLGSDCVMQPSGSIASKGPSSPASLSPAIQGYLAQKLKRGLSPTTVRYHAAVLHEALRLVQERLGHSTPAFTLSVYGHVLPGMQRDAARRLEARLLGGLAAN